MYQQWWLGNTFSFDLTCSGQNNASTPQLFIPLSQTRLWMYKDGLITRVATASSRWTWCSTASLPVLVPEPLWYEIAYITSMTYDIVCIHNKNIKCRFLGGHERKSLENWVIESPFLGIQVEANARLYTRPPSLFQCIDLFPVVTSSRKSNFVDTQNA